MFPQFGATAETLSKASTMVFRIGTDAHLYDDPEDGNILQLLDSKFDSEKCEALKRLLALIAQGFDVSNLFPQVVKNVASQYLEVKKLVYLYLLHYAEKRPSEALLSINCFQKDLGDPNPLVRAWALRTMAGIRLHVVAPIVLVAVGKCSRDPSVYVRKCAANAIPKLYELRIEENNSSIKEIIGILLNDHSPGVVGAAAAAFATVCPNNFCLIDKSYRRLCQILPDVEEWGQVVLIDVLLRYVMAKHGLVKESLMFFLDHSETSYLDKDGSLSSFRGEENDDLIVKANSALASIISRSYIEGPDEFLSRSSLSCRNLESLNPGKYTSYKSNDDVKILLQCTSPLLWSYNSAVVIGAAGVHWIMAPMEDVNRIVKPLLFVLRSSNASRYVVLCNIQVFARAIPSMFAPYFEDFFISCSDTYEIRSLKLNILSSIATVSSISAILKEFQDYIRDPHRRFAADTISALGICAQRIPTMAETCLDWLLALTRQEPVSGDFGLTAEEAGVLTQVIVSITSIVKQNPSNHEKVIIQLLRRLDSIRVPAARAMIIWMVGEYNSLGGTIPKMLGTILKYLAWCFKSEASEAKLQILTAAVKVLSNSRGEDYLSVKKMVHYVLELAEYDLNFDIRDRARLLKKLLELNTRLSTLETETKGFPQNSGAQCMLSDKIFGGKLKPVAPETSNHRFYLPGSLSQIVLHAAPAYEPLPKPCSLVLDGSAEISNNFQGMNLQATKGNKIDDDLEASSGSFDEESASDYSSQQSVTGSTSSPGAHIYDNVSASEEDTGSTDQLIQISETENASRKEVVVPQQSQEEIEELMSKTALESWLSSSTNKGISDFGQVGKSTARITLGDIGTRIKPKSYILLDPANGNGLKVEYSFSSHVSSISPLLICVEVSFKNCTTELMSRVTLVDESVNSTLGSESFLISDNEMPTLVPVEEIETLGAGQIAKRTIQVRFHHHLLPLKLTVLCNDKTIPVKLRPDIGYFVKPLPMDLDTFIIKESRLPGMFEYERRCNFIDHLDEFKGEGIEVKDKFILICESIALKMLGSSNLFPVCMDMPVESKLDDATGLCLRFSCEILSVSVPCLITVTVEGKCSDPIDLSVKVNCEETVFGLNLLNRVVNFLVEAP